MYIMKSVIENENFHPLFSKDFFHSDLVSIGVMSDPTQN